MRQSLLRVVAGVHPAGVHPARRAEGEADEAADAGADQRRERRSLPRCDVTRMARVGCHPHRREGHPGNGADQCALPSVEDLPVLVCEALDVGLRDGARGASFGGREVNAVSTQVGEWADEAFAGVQRDLHEPARRDAQDLPGVGRGAQSSSATRAPYGAPWRQRCSSAKCDMRSDASEVRGMDAPAA